METEISAKSTRVQDTQRPSEKRRSWSRTPPDGRRCPSGNRPLQRGISFIAGRFHTAWVETGRTARVGAPSPEANSPVGGG